MNDKTTQPKPLNALVDLAIFLAAMYLVRVIYIDSLGFWGNALGRSILTVGTATALLYYRKQSWKDLGLIKPNNLLKMIGIAALTLGGTVLSMMIFKVFVQELLFGVEEEAVETTKPAFDALKGNWPYFFSIIGFVWIESFLEELQDRGFSLNRFEALFSKIPFSAIFAVVAQAAIFGFRHSYDWSPRSMTTGLIGFVFGLVYVLSGRNLWPLIIAHVILNTMSMVGRV